jgi:hypothetical protein
MILEEDLVKNADNAREGQCRNPSSGISTSRDRDETWHVLTIKIFQATIKRRQAKAKLTRIRLRQLAYS